jgi:hypothetical protein
MPDADVKLENAEAVVEGNWLKVECWDIKLDAADRRSRPTGERRALVHGSNDELVVNYADDYPGGVTIGGEIHIPGRIKENKLHLEGTDLILDHPDRRSARRGERRALVHGFNDELILNYSDDYPGGTVVHGDFEVQRGGTFRLKNSEGQTIIQAGRLGNLSLGGNGQDGAIILRDADGNDLIKIDTQYKRIDFKDTGATVRVRIDCDDFTVSSWPQWPGAAVASRLDLISELRRMKEEILTLRSQVDDLLSG